MVSKRKEPLGKFSGGSNFFIVKGLVFENCFDGGRGVGQREKFVTDAILVAEAFESFVDGVVVNLACARLVASGAIGDVNVSDLVKIFFNVVTERAFIVLHVVRVEENHQLRGADEPRDFRCHLRRLQKVSDVVKL